MWHFSDMTNRPDHVAARRAKADIAAGTILDPKLTLPLVEVGIAFRAHMHDARLHGAVCVSETTLGCPG
jgi:hypothetical protein